LECKTENLFFIRAGITENVDGIFKISKVFTTLLILSGKEGENIKQLPLSQSKQNH
jgi:hypothetical protein